MVLCGRALPDSSLSLSLSLPLSFRIDEEVVDDDMDPHFVSSAMSVRHLSAADWISGFSFRGSPSFVPYRSCFVFVCLFVFGRRPASAEWSLNDGSPVPGRHSPRSFSGVAEFSNRVSLSLSLTAMASVVTSRLVSFFVDFITIHLILPCFTQFRI